MKSILLFVCMLLSVIYTFGQEIDFKNYQVKRLNSITAVKTDEKGRHFFKDSTDRIKSGHRFTIAHANTIKDSLIISVWGWQENTSNWQLYNEPTKRHSTYIDYQTNPNSIRDSLIPTYFLISSSDLDAYAKKRYSANFWHGQFSVGIASIPIKIRPGENFDFGENLTLGGSLAYRWRLHNFEPIFLNFVGLLAFSDVDLNSENTGKKIAEPISDLRALTSGIGLIADFHNIQLGLYYGWDMLSAANQKKFEWIHNGNPWWGIGIGISLFNTERKNTPEGKN